MASNLMALVKDYLSDDVLNKISTHLGERKEGVAMAADSAVPSILAGLMQKTSDPNGAESLMQSIAEGEGRGEILGNLSGRVDNESSVKDLISSGGGILNSTFGSKAQTITDHIASKAGISNRSGWSVTAILAPVVLGVIGKTLRSEGALNAGGIMNLLRGQRGYLKGMLPASLSGILEPGIGEAMPAAGSATPRGMRIWPLAMIGLALIALFVLLRGLDYMRKDSVTPNVRKATNMTGIGVGSARPSGLAVTGEMSARKLPNGKELRFPASGVESRLLGFIEDRNAPVDQSTWFSFDRVTFEPNKAALKPESDEQLQNVAEIMRAYPRVTMRLGGYTDNLGDAGENMALSQKRAEAVKSELSALGVDPSRLQAKGYGEEHPVADNATEEGRAKNRRIDMNVTGK